MNINKFTVKQLIIASGTARKLDRKEIARIAKCVPSYITYMDTVDGFSDLIKMFQLLPHDQDTKEYKGLATIYMEIGRLFYGLGDNNAV